MMRKLLFIIVLIIYSCSESNNEYEYIVKDQDFRTEVLINNSGNYIELENGYTYFEDGTKIFSKARRLLRFDSHHKHSGTTSSDCKARFVLNINYITRELLKYDEVQAWKNWHWL